MTPRLLTEREASKYTGVGMDMLKKLGIPRRRVYPGMKGLKYYTKDLDDWLDKLPKDGQGSTPQNWLGRFDGDDQNSRRQGVHQQG